MLLVVTYPQAVWTMLRDICRVHDEVVVRQLGHVALSDETELAAFLALRLRKKHDENVQIEQIQPFNEFTAIPDAIREAAAACGDHKSPAIPYSKLASKIDHPPAAEV